MPFSQHLLYEKDSRGSQFFHSLVPADRPSTILQWSLQLVDRSAIDGKGKNPHKLLPYVHQYRQTGVYQSYTEVSTRTVMAGRGGKCRRAGYHGGRSEERRGGE